MPSVAYGLGVTKRPSGVVSRRAIFRWFYQIVKTTCTIEPLTPRKYRGTRALATQYDDGAC